MKTSQNQNQIQIIIKAVKDGAILPFSIGVVAGLLAVLLPKDYNIPFVNIMKENICVETLLFFYSFVSASYGAWFILIGLFPALCERFGIEPSPIARLPYLFIMYAASTSGLILASLVTNTYDKIAVQHPVSLLFYIAVLAVFSVCIKHSNRKSMDTAKNRFYSVATGICHLMLLALCYMLALAKAWNIPINIF